MREYFEERYADYARRVPAWVPFLTALRSSADEHG